MALSITLLGKLGVARGRASVPLPPSKKTRALLAYLVATGRPQSRAHLCELLWEGPDDPRAALRWSLTKIRTILDEGATTRIVADHEQVSFAAHGAEVDMAVLRDEIGLDPAGASTDALIRAAGCFQGEFLDGIDLPDCYRYHEWWTAERERLRALRVGILSTIADRLHDDPDGALTYARARLMVDPFAEAAHVAVIQLLNAAGRTREALQQYESCRRMLEGQLGAKPSATLERARAALGSVPQTTVVSPPRIDATPPAQGKPLVGRSPEVNAITAAVAQAAAGRNRDVIWISGEPGIGKTRLLEELSAQMRGRGGTVVSGRAYEVEMARSYGPWIDALRSAGLDMPTDTGGGDRQQFFDAVVARLTQLTTAGRAVAVVLDDVQWFDEASAGLLHYVVRAFADSPVLVACAARSTELADNAAATALTRALRSDGRLRHLPLDRLTATAIGELVGAIDRTVDAGRVFAQSEGNALVAIEIARALAQGRQTLPDTVDGLIADRLERLDDYARDLVPWAAALGRSFSPEILRLVSGLAPAELLSAMEELERRGVIRASASTAATYDFTHDLIRQAAYHQLSEPRRRIVHLQLARALRTLRDPDAAFAGDIAHHAMLGGDYELAADASVSAGERSLRMFAYADAYALAERAMRCLDGLARPVRIRLHMALLKIAVNASVAVPDARNVDGDVSRVLAEAQEAGLMPEVATGFYLLSFRHHQDGNYAAAHDDTLRAAEASRTGDLATVARALGTTGRCLALIEREIPRAESLLVEAQGLAVKAGVELTDIPWGLGLVRAFAGEYDEAVRLLDTAVALARREQDHWAECEGLQRLALVELERGDPAAAHARAKAMALVAAQMGEGSEAPFAAMLEALAAMVTGDRAASEHVEQALDVLRRIDAKAMLARALTLAAATDLECGRLDLAAARADEALTAARVVGRRSEIVTALAILARVAARRGDSAAANRYAQAATDDLRDPDAVAAHARRAALAIESSRPA